MLSGVLGVYDAGVVSGIDGYSLDEKLGRGTWQLRAMWLDAFSLVVIAIDVRLDYGHFVCGESPRLVGADRSRVAHCFAGV